MTTPNPLKVSNSSIQTFQDCRRKWYLGSYRRLTKRDERMTGPFAFGSRIHLALERYYNDTSQDLLKIWADLIHEDRMIVESSSWGDTSDFDNEAELGRIMLEGYLQWIDEEGIDSDYEVVSNEEKLSAPMLDGKIELVGKIDQRIRRRADGVRLIRDFKTSGNFTDLTRMLQMNEQFLTYMVLEQLKLDEQDRVDGGQIIALKKVRRSANARPPFYEHMEVRFNVFALRSFWIKLHGRLMDMLAVRDALDAGVDHRQVAYPRPTRDCSWKCEFYAICPMFDDGSAVEAAIEMAYTEDDPFAYYQDDPKKTATA